MSTKLFEQAAAAIDLATKDRAASDTVAMNVGDLCVILGLLRSLSSQSLSLSEARERGDEYERLYRQTHLDYVAAEYKLEAAAVELSEAREALKPFAAVADEMEGSYTKPLRDDWRVPNGWLSIGDCRKARSALENGPAGLADATNDPASSDLSSLRKGAEVMRAAIKSVTDATGAYLPPDGISKDELISRVLAATDNPEINAVMLGGRNGAP